MFLTNVLTNLGGRFSNAKPLPERKACANLHRQPYCERNDDICGYCYQSETRTVKLGFKHLFNLEFKVRSTLAPCKNV